MAKRKKPSGSACIEPNLPWGGYSLLIKPQQIESYGIANEPIRELLRSVDFVDWFGSPPKGQQVETVERLVKEHFESLAEFLPERAAVVPEIRFIHDWQQVEPLADESHYQQDASRWPRCLGRWQREQVQRCVQAGTLQPFLKPPLWPDTTFPHPNIVGNILSTTESEVLPAALPHENRQAAWRLICEVHNNLHNAALWEVLRNLQPMPPNPYVNLLQAYRLQAFPLLETEDNILMIFTASDA